MVESTPDRNGELPYRDLLLGWGFTLDELPAVLARIEDPNGPRNTVIDFGTTALDVKQEGDYRDDPYMGTLALVNRDNRVIGREELMFTEPTEEALLRGHAGGIGNAANAIGKVVENERKMREAAGVRIITVSGNARVKAMALMARLGPGRVGEIWKGKIHPEIDTSLLSTHAGDPPAGLSDIRIQKDAVPGVAQGDRAIYFRAGASSTTVPTREDLLEIAVRRPGNVNVSYPGLFPNGMDRDGRILADYLCKAKSVCPMVSFDVHGFTQLDHIRPALQQSDMCNMNIGEAARILLGRTIEKPDELSCSKKSALWYELAREFIRYMGLSSGRLRMATVTDRRGCFVLFLGKASQSRSVYVPSPCADIAADDKTGAGDVRYGFQRFYLAREKRKAWKEGSLPFEDAITAVQIGQIATTLHVQAKRKNAFAGVTMAALERVARSGQTFTTLADLQAALR